MGVGDAFKEGLQHASDQGDGYDSINGDEDLGGWANRCDIAIANCGGDDDCKVEGIDEGPALCDVEEDGGGGEVEGDTGESANRAG